jgi:cation-transporting ATPase E
MDKTGTLTTGHERFARLEPLEASGDELRAFAGAFAASATARDRTVDAIRDGCPADARPPVREVPFSAARRWSAVELDPEGALVLGAPEVLLPHVSSAREQLAAAVDARTAEGLRVMVLARSATLGASDPGALRALGLVCLAEDLRADARATVERFAHAGIAIKLISGDHPNTLRAIARATGVEDDHAVTGAEIDAMDEPALRECVRTTSLFARTTPHQKERLIHAIRADGSYTAMVGDGINDVLALKAANLGISLRGGAASARAVADMLLLDDEIGALVPAAAEGRRILRGMRDILRIFLTRVIYAALVIAALTVIDGAFPFTPTQNALLTLLTVGLPSIALAAWAPAEAIGRDDLGRSLARIVVPAGWSIALLGFFAYVAVLARGGDFRDASSTLTTLCVLCGLLFLVFIADDTGDRFIPAPKDLRRVALAVVMLVAYVIVVATPASRAVFDLVPPSLPEAALTLAGAVLWIVALRWALQAHALDAALGLRL